MRSEPMKILGIVTARGGSKRLPNKNMAKLGGKPLVLWSVEVGLATCAKVVTSTDSARIAETVAEAGSMALMRPLELSQDDTPSEDVVIHAARWASRDEQFNAVLLLQPTSPFRTAQDVRSAIELMERTSADSVISVVEFSTKGYLFGFGHAGRLRDMSTVETTFTPNGAIYLIKWDHLLDGGDWYGDHAYGYVMPADRSFDIDTHADFAAAEALLEAGDGNYRPDNKKAKAPL